MIRFFLHTFKKCDIFSRPITLWLYRKEVYQTTTGGVLSILLILLCALFFWNSLLNIFNKNTLYITTQEAINIDPPSISFQKNFAFYLQPLELNQRDNKKYFDIELILGNYSWTNDGQQIKIKNKLNFSNCNSENFPSEIQDYFNNTDFKQWMCPDSKEKNEIKGNIFSKSFQFIQIKVSKCTEINGIKCASDEEINKIKLLNSGKIYLSLSFVNNLVNAQNLENPLIPYLDQNLIVFNNAKFFKQRDVFFTKRNIYTDDSLIFEENYDNKNEFITYDQKYDEYIIEDLNDNNYVSIYLRSSSITKDHYRKTEKLLFFIENIGGLWSFLFLVFYQLVRLLNKHKFILKIANALYTFNEENISLTINENQIIDKTNQKQKVLFSNTLKNFFINFKTKILKYIKTKNKSKKFKYDLFSALKLIFKPFKIKVETKKRLDNIYYNIAKDLDIIQILLKINQIDKLKELFLDSDQRILFEYSAKPNLDDNAKKRMNISRQSIDYRVKTKHIKSNTSLNNFESQKNITDLYDYKYDEKFYSHLFKAFKNIKNKADNNFKNSEISKNINEKLFLMMDRDLRGIFEKEIENEIKKNTFKKNSK